MNNILSANKLTYQGDKLSVYAASTASTWIWAPALFVSSSIAYYYGLIGLAIFLIPNILCLLIFGAVSQYVVNHNLANVSFLQLIDNASTRQKTTHLIIGSTVTFCSTIVQLLGIGIVANTWFNAGPLIPSIIISIVGLIIVWNGGIKNSIITDYYKWIIIAIASIIVLGYTVYTVPFTFSDLKIFDYNDIHFLLMFGTTTAIGLLTSPYVDQTMWQRAFSTNKNSITKMFGLAAIMFAIVPTAFGLAAMIFATQGTIPNWDISSAIGINTIGIVLAIAIVFTLLSTIDSNLCAIENYARTEFNQNGRAAMTVTLLLAIIVVNTVNLSVTELFLIYGSIRTVGAIPTLLISFNRFNEQRLFIGTILGLILGSLGYVIATLSGFTYPAIFTIIALLLPMIGYSNTK